MKSLGATLEKRIKQTVELLEIVVPGLGPGLMFVDFTSF